MDIVCVGDCGVDVYEPSGETRVGGITANVARHARAVFAPDDDIHIVSCIGDDHAASLVLDAFAGSGIDCHISGMLGMTPVQSIEIKPDGEKHFIHYEPGVLADFRFTEEQRKLIARADIVVAPVYLQIVGLFDAMMSIPTRGRVAIDFADFLEHPDFELLHNYIDRIDIGFFGLTSSDTAAIQEIARLADDHGKIFVVTLGPDGSIVFFADRQYEGDALPVSQIVDTTGAGDAYAAAFLAEYCRNGDIDAAIARGSALAARVVAHMGSYDAGQSPVRS